MIDTKNLHIDLDIADECGYPTLVMSTDIIKELLDALERKDRVIRSIKQEAETALVIGDEIGMRDGLVQILKEADQEFGITTRN